MENLNELINYLSIDHHPDTWAEYASEYASELLQKFTAEEWDELIKVWNHQSVPWQLRLTDILYNATSEKKYEILESMVLHTQDPVRMYAVEALDLNTPVYKVPANIAAYLKSLQGSGISSQLDGFIKSLLIHEKI